MKRPAATILIGYWHIEEIASALALKFSSKKGVAPTSAYQLNGHAQRFLLSPAARLFGFPTTFTLYSLRFSKLIGIDMLRYAMNYYAVSLLICTCATIALVPPRFTTGIEPLPHVPTSFFNDVTI